jgi:predicted aspartyl protease
MPLPPAQIDKTLRAVIRLKITGPAKSAYMNFEIDTGSQPELIISDEWATHLGLSGLSNQDVTLANGETIEAVVAEGTVDWLDGQRLVDVIVFPSSAKLQPFASPSRAKHAGLIDGLLGRRLLKHGAVLHMDYVAKTGNVKLFDRDES